MKDKINGIKNEKPFKTLDLVIYALVIILTLSLFLIFLPKNGALTKIYCEYNKTLVFDYDFTTNELTVVSNDDIIIEKQESDGVITIKVSFNNGSFNTVKITNNSVSVIDSNCSTKKDCVHTKSITKNGQSIICLPHGLTIKSLGDGGTPQHPTVG